MTTFVNNTPLTADLTDVTPNILDLNAGPHAFAYASGRQVIVVTNGEAVPLTINLLGDGQTDFECPGYGTVDVSSGKDFVIPAGETATIYTAKISQYLGASGNNVAMTITGSTAPSLASAWISTY